MYLGSPFDKSLTKACQLRAAIAFDSAATCGILRDSKSRTRPLSSVGSGPLSFPDSEFRLSGLTEIVLLLQRKTARPEATR